MREFPRVRCAWELVPGGDEWVTCGWSSVVAITMRGRDLINSVLPDEALMEIMQYVDGRSSDRDACALVCKRWRALESACRHSLTLGATGQSDTCLAKMVQRFTNLRQVCVDERLPVPLPTNRRFPHRHALCSRIMRPFLVSHRSSLSMKQDVMLLVLSVACMRGF